MKKITPKELEEMKNIDLITVDPNTLVDINDVIIDESLNKEDKIINFIEQIKNPYCYKCGKMIVKISFADTDKTLEDVIESYINTL